ncbi:MULTISPECIES: quaternary amine ABC transporter ATP-binding protein [Aerococcus]|uniref:Quaternary amine transport ATP-binding protein n=2 Tax=Aerococcus TaxID=1375 RepID=A0A329P642_9LACT|nr:MULTISPECIES: glycine betaine/L-proline ABC transporter ATP-binding protein [Aerococcus]KAA9219563.1 glycine betaine/L-proline ABC transporter ATP-binding protein [Aerococcus loyolae]KAA9266582.1 glycine betaine/L-proline ABC transporter ATP-binding protein [Aerococcus loyolae]MCY3025387.1 glycine betaine/L-proline ABC transporter ATP-binding protein [Aerococcus loyolae]MCY3027449.1 glycine betaine/L-proline ABC transporter ATP-binding protein [Aerococcus loyolae]MCY3029075.1 glycine betain
MASIKVENLTKIFGSAQAIDKAKKLVEKGESKEEIVNQTGATVGVYDASFEVNDGEIFVIMGLSGSGKSTLLRMLNRLIEPTHGQVSIDGENVTQANDEELRNIRRKKVSMVFQSFALFPHKTILENTEFGLEIQGVDGEERRKRAQDALETMGLSAYQDQLPEQLSGGMQQRVGLARALASDTDILLMDEAFSALDPLIRANMQDELIELQSKLNKTIVFITHDLDEALRLGDRIVLMRNGHIEQIGTGEEILENPANDYVETFVGGVDRSKVFTAENAMEAPGYVFNKDRVGARVALKIMQNEHTSTLYVIDGDRKIHGYVTDKDLADLIRQNKHTKNIHVDEIIRTDNPLVNRNTPINEMYDLMSDTNMPIAVVDDDERLLGYVDRRLVIDQLSGQGGDNNE